MVPQDQTECWEQTRHVSLLFSYYCCADEFSQRVAQAAASVLGTAGALTHEALFIGVDLFQFAPVPGLAGAAHTLLKIWDAVGLVSVSVFGFCISFPLQRDFWSAM